MLRDRPLRQFGLAALAASLLTTASPVIAAEGPYPASSFLSKFKLDWSSLQRKAAESDNWPTTWAADGFVYSNWGDGMGFVEDNSRKDYVSLGVAKLTGKDAGSLKGENLIGGRRPTIASCLPSFGGPTDRSKSGVAGACGGKGLHGKSRSILAVDDDLYMFVTPSRGDDGYTEARLYKAPIGTNNWRRANWAFTKDPPERLLEPGFLQAGKNNRDAGEYVYAYAARHDPVRNGVLAIQKGSKGGEITLLRVPRKADLMDRDSWDFYAGSDAAGAKWSRNVADAKATIVDPKGVGWTTSATYVKGLKRYLVATQHTEHAAGKFTLLEGKNPWGPWKTVTQTTIEDPQKRIDTRGFYYNFLANSFSEDGKTFTLVYTGRGNGDALLAVDGSFDKGEDTPDAEEVAAVQEAMERRANRGGSLAKAMDLGRRTSSQRQQDTRAGLVASLAALPEESRLGLTAFPVGEAPLPDAERSDPTRAGFTEAFAPDGQDGGVGFNYSFSNGTRLGMVMSDYADSARNGQDNSASGSSLASKTVDLYVQQRLGGFELETRLAYSRDRYRMSEFDERSDRRDKVSFDGNTSSVSQRIGYPLRKKTLLVTPWAELGYETQKVDGFTVGSAYFADESFAASEVSDTLVSLGLDAALDPIALGERTSLTLQGGLYYTHGLAQDDYELRVREAGSGSTRTETIGRPATRLAGLTLGANLAYNSFLELESTLAMEQDLERGDTEVAPRIALTLNF